MEPTWRPARWSSRRDSAKNMGQPCAMSGRLAIHAEWGLPLIVRSVRTHLVASSELVSRRCMSHSPDNHTPSSRRDLVAPGRPSDQRSSTARPTSARPTARRPTAWCAIPSATKSCLSSTASRRETTQANCWGTGRTAFPSYSDLTEAIRLPWSRAGLPDLRRRTDERHALARRAPGDAGRHGATDEHRQRPARVPQRGSGVRRRRGRLRRDDSRRAPTTGQEGSPHVQRPHR